jgi:hypothetical protein
LIDRWGRIECSLYEVKKIENLIVILETKDAKNQILTHVSSPPVFYDKKRKIDWKIIDVERFESKFFAATPCITANCLSNAVPIVPAPKMPTLLMTITPPHFISF